MIIQSFYSKHRKILPLEVELKVVRGLPTLQVLGLPDQSLRESAFRIKSAITTQGFSWPKAQQVLVNLRPAHIKKQSQGIELAIAVALLVETGQIQLAQGEGNFYVYGELGLDGQVLPPKDLETLRPWLKEEDQILTSIKGELAHPGRISLESLSDLNSPLICDDSFKVSDQKRPSPKVPPYLFSKDHARLLALSALTKAPTLLAGPPGSGKTTFAESLYHLLPALYEEEFLNLRAHHLQLGEDLSFRPFVSPHHSTPMMSLIGGGNHPLPGEIVKAHGGLLILDEFLLFPSRVIDALREPLVSKKIKVARAGQGVTWPADFHFVATTNLCPCGRLSSKKNLHCGYTLQKCRSTWEKLSGPMLDRFDLVLLTEPYRGK
ncbi:MAG: ATP-binding protein, partial [Bdellovibrionales bacterium]|nr:ATP-binding protein [Bdellovibrionales bacterium]